MVGSFKDSYQEIMDLKMSPKKILGFMKLVGSIEKKVMLRKMDFWLPLKVKYQGLENECHSQPQSLRKKKVILEKMQEFSKKIEQDKNALDEMIRKFGKQIQIRKVCDTISVDDDHVVPNKFSASEVNGLSPNRSFGLAFCDISAIEADQKAKTRREGRHSKRGHSTESMHFAQETSPADNDVDAQWEQVKNMENLADDDDDDESPFKFNDTALEIYQGLGLQNPHGNQGGSAGKKKNASPAIGRLDQAGHTQEFDLGETLGGNEGTNFRVLNDSSRDHLIGHSGLHANTSLLSGSNTSFSRIMSHYGANEGAKPESKRTGKYAAQMTERDSENMDGEL